jgi:two-component sensor histidine kinase
LALYADPAKETLARECERFYPPHSAFQDHPVVKVIQTGQTIFMPEIPDALLQKLARDAGQLARLRELGIKSAAIIPLTAHGQTFGAISLIWAGSGRCCAPADLATIEELARRAALALDNARLYREAQAEIAARKQAEQQLEASLQEKQILLKEVYHRVKNNLQAVSNLLFLQAEQIKDQHVREIFYEAQERVNSIALVHEKLYQTEDLSRVSFGEYLHSLASHLVRSNHARDRGVRLEIKSAEVQLDMETAIPLGIIINELVSNAFKHAFPADQARLADQADEIRIELRLETDRTLRLTVRDNGVGFPKGLEPANSGSLGLQLVHMLVQQLDGCLEFRRQKRGTLFQIKLNRQL